MVNLITLSRFIGACLLYPFFVSYGSLTVAFMCTIFYLTDALDGFLARKYKIYTFFGAIFDVLSDKLLNIMSFIILISITKYAIILLILEILILICAYFVKTLKVALIGKLKMIVLGINVICLFILHHFNIQINYIYMLPLITLEIITLIVYMQSFSKSNLRKYSNIKTIYIKDLFKNILNPSFYENYKNADAIKATFKEV